MAASTSSLVIDASVFVSWLLPDETTAPVRKLFREVIEGENKNVYAPSLLDFELANALKMAVDRKRIEEADSLDLWQVLISTPVDRVNPSNFSAIIKLSLKHKLSAYDASYLAVAQETRSTLCTLDKDFERKVKGVVEVYHWQ